MWNSGLRNILIAALITQSYAARIGDGTRSLYTGKNVNRVDGRGSCMADGFLYASETSIPRDHPCHYCICYQSKVACYWKQCGAPPKNCQVMNFENVCNPSLYVCDIPAESREEPQLAFGDRLNSLRFSRRKRDLKGAAASAAAVTATMILDEVPSIQFKEAWQQFNKQRRKKRAIANRLEDIYGDTSCKILGVRYLLGEVIGVASDICMECRCAAGSMFCSPKCCFQPAPFVIRQNVQSNLLLNAQSRKSELRSHPLHYIKNQYSRGTFL